VFIIKQKAVILIVTLGYCSSFMLPEHRNPVEEQAQESEQEYYGSLQKIEEI
jgi:hypothetical protein